MAVVCLGLVTVQAAARQPDALASSTEIIVVTTSDWNAVEGSLQRYERRDPRQKWVPAGAPVTVVVGKSGLGWGVGAVSLDANVRTASDPVKKEGDGKAPAGVFVLSRAFGYAPQDLAGAKMPYVPLTATVECVDDTNSKFYNQVLDRGSVAPDWASSEHMLRSDELYRWGVVVDHNSDPARPGAGSCIFLHIWRGPRQGTVGCTAMPQEQLETVLGWLDPARKPLLVQMPEQQYRSLQKKLGLPALPTSGLAQSDQSAVSEGYGNATLVFSHQLAAGPRTPLAGAAPPPGVASLAFQQPADTGLQRDIELGVVVERIDKGFEADKAGIREGDILLGWSYGNNKGQFESPFDLSTIEMEQGPLGSVTLEGMRGSERLVWALGPDAWGVDARPNFSGTALSVYQQCQGIEQADKPDGLGKCWNRLAEDAAHPSWLGAWLLSHSGTAIAQRKLWKEADDLFQAAMDSALKIGRPGVLAGLLRSWAHSFWDRQDYIQAEKYYQQALAESSTPSDQNLTAAASLHSLGIVAERRGDPVKATEYLVRALTIREKLAPQSLEVARTLRVLGAAAFEIGNLQKSGEYAHRGLEILQKLVPGSSELAASMINLAAVERHRGDLAAADGYYNQALEIEQRLFPGGRGVGVCFNGLANVARDRGDLVRADRYDRQALAVHEKRAPGSFDVALTLGNMGITSENRGDLAGAEEHYRKALAIQEKLTPGSLILAGTFGALGDLALKRGDLVQATSYAHQSLDLLRKFAPGSLGEADELGTLADIAQRTGDLTKAENLYGQALAIRASLAPKSRGYAECLAAMAGIVRRQGRLDAASQMFEKALNALDDQLAQLGGSEEARSGFRAQHADFYREYIDLLVTQGRQTEAFEVLERWRARTLLEMLLESRVNIRQGVDAGLLAKERSLKAEVIAKTDRRLRLLSDKHTAEQEAAIDQEIERTISEYQEMQGQIRASSPAYAALTQPQPLKLKDVQDLLLADDTILLEYMLGDQRSYLFVVTRSSLVAYELPKRAEIEAAVRRVHDLLTVRGHSPANETEIQRDARWSAAEVALPAAAEKLSGMILKPVSAQLQRNRLLIVGDGALAFVPFASLPEPGGQAGARQFHLVEKHEVVNLPSASVLAALRREKKAQKRVPLTVAVLADPVFDTRDARVRRFVKTSAAAYSSEEEDSPESAFSADLMTRSANDAGLTRGGALHFPRLLYSRQEAEAILAVTPLSQGMRALDFRASRSTATSPELSQYRIVHFATHGILDSIHPELSGLVLSLVDREGRAQRGFLGLEDVYNLKLPADMVVLSACETGLGRQIDGEGLEGLTRGFMYAGASRVVASLWNVNDIATSVLMERFYRGMLRDGLPPSSALRRAQLSMLRQKRWTNPYYWGAFMIQGEWKTN
jgi:CHAT domain-containing protein/L,D-peptidoglycan transpeptidase YkuD (ErfK/YbiS/YcfS/YnhG family)/Tfp pilus assembly protein PilF